MDDLIDRQAAINKLNERQRKLIYCFGFENDAVKIMDIAKSIVIAMPSAQHERKTGEWLPHYEYCKKHKLLPSGPVAFWWCDQCEQGVEHPTNFCPNCGSYNGGEQDEID